MADEKKPIKRLGGLNSGPGAGRLGEQIIVIAQLQAAPLVAARPESAACCLAGFAGGLRGADGAAPSSAAATASVGGAAAAGGRKVGAAAATLAATCIELSNHPCLL